MPAHKTAWTAALAGLKRSCKQCKACMDRKKCLNKCVRADVVQKPAHKTARTAALSGLKRSCKQCRACMDRKKCPNKCVRADVVQKLALPVGRCIKCLKTKKVSCHCAQDKRRFFETDEQYAALRQTCVAAHTVAVAKLAVEQANRPRVTRSGLPIVAVSGGSEGCGVSGDSGVSVSRVSGGSEGSGVSGDSGVSVSVGSEVSADVAIVAEDEPESPRLKSLCFSKSSESVQLMPSLQPPFVFTEDQVRFMKLQQKTCPVARSIVANLARKTRETREDSPLVERETREDTPRLERVTREDTPLLERAPSLSAVNEQIEEMSGMELLNRQLSGIKEHEGLQLSGNDGFELSDMDISGMMMNTGFSGVENEFEHALDMDDSMYAKLPRARSPSPDPFGRSPNPDPFGGSPSPEPNTTVTSFKPRSESPSHFVLNADTSPQWSPQSSPESTPPPLSPMAHFRERPLARFREQPLAPDSNAAKEPLAPDSNAARKRAADSNAGKMRESPLAPDSNAGKERESPLAPDSNADKESAPDSNAGRESTPDSDAGNESAPDSDSESEVSEREDAETMVKTGSVSRAKRALQREQREQCEPVEKKKRSHHKNLTPEQMAARNASKALEVVMKANRCKRSHHKHVDIATQSAKSEHTRARKLANAGRRVHRAKGDSPGIRHVQRESVFAPIVTHAVLSDAESAKTAEEYTNALWAGFDKVSYSNSEAAIVQLAAQELFSRLCVSTDVRAALLDQSTLTHTLADARRMTKGRLLVLLLRGLAVGLDGGLQQAGLDMQARLMQSYGNDDTGLFKNHDTPCSNTARPCISCAVLVSIASPVESLLKANATSPAMQLTTAMVAPMCVACCNSVVNALAAGGMGELVMQIMRLEDTDKAVVTELIGHGSAATLVEFMANLFTRTPPPAKKVSRRRQRVTAIEVDL